MMLGKCNVAVFHGGHALVKVDVVLAIMAGPKDTGRCRSRLADKM